MLSVRIDVENLTVRFGKLVAVDRLNIHAEATRVGILGQNGSGKTTLLSVAAGLLLPNAGVLRINGFEPYREREKAASEISFIFEKFYFPFKIKVSKLLKLLLDERGLRRDILNEIILDMGLQSLLDKNMNELSSGEEQMVYTLSLISSPLRIMILDEPFSHLDIFRAARFYNKLMKHDSSLILTSHIPEEIEMLADYFIILQEGKLLWSGDRQKLISSDIYEVYLSPGSAYEGEIMYSYGGIALVREDPENLFRLMKKNVILGFRKSGIRRIYGEH